MEADKTAAPSPLSMLRKHRHQVARVALFVPPIVLALAALYVASSARIFTASNHLAAVLSQAPPLPQDPDEELLDGNKLPLIAPPPPKAGKVTTTTEAISDELWKAFERLGVPQLSRLPSAATKTDRVYSPTTIVTTNVENGEVCECDLVYDLDCLDAIRCLNPSLDPTAIRLGLDTRQAIKDLTSVFAGKVFPGQSANPIGKALQYSTIRSFVDWTHRNKLPQSYWNARSTFVDANRYPPCAKLKVSGFSCFFRNLDVQEDHGNLELDALVENNKTTTTTTTLGSKQILDIIRDDITQFRKAYGDIDNPPPALGPLMTFAHLTRILFNRQPHLQALYLQLLETIPAQVPPNTTLPPLRVSVHMRRADACGHSKKRYDDRASPLSSPAQTTDVRKCYTTSVYMQALKLVQQITRGRPLEVYLASDFAGSVLHDDIAKNFKDLYETITWHHLDYGGAQNRSALFNYKTKMIESKWNHNQPALGETAVLDAWLLSHGQVLIGHVGSRFGKLGWLLATARHNAFVPYKTVDGHSYCCDIDEPCGVVAPYIKSMRNCLTFTVQSLKLKMDNYWKNGNINRITYFNSTGFGKK